MRREPNDLAIFAKVDWILANILTGSLQLILSEAALWQMHTRAHALAQQFDWGPGSLWACMLILPRWPLRLAHVHSGASDGP